MNMEAKLWFMVLCGLAVLLSYLAGFWRRKTAAAAFAAARRYRQRARPLLPSGGTGGPSGSLPHVLFRPFGLFRGPSAAQAVQIARNKVAFYGYYYPSRYADLIDDEQRAFCCSLYQFKEGENHGIEFLRRACPS